jgi:hypothetical protein
VSRRGRHWLRASATSAGLRLQHAAGNGAVTPDTAQDAVNADAAGAGGMTVRRIVLRAEAARENGRVLAAAGRTNMEQTAGGQR